MTVEDLLKPRYKVINPYPNSPFTDGQVIVLEKDKLGGYYFRWAEHDGFNREYQSFFDEYPHLFKKLEWWEEREEKDMPEYLKHTLKTGTTTYHKIIKWDMKYMIGYMDEKYVCDLRLWSSQYNYQPATKEQYYNQK